MPLTQDAATISFRNLTGDYFVPDNLEMHDARERENNKKDKQQ